MESVNAEIPTFLLVFVSLIENSRWIFLSLALLVSGSSGVSGVFRSLGLLRSMGSLGSLGLWVFSGLWVSGSLGSLGLWVSGPLGLWLVRSLSQKKQES